MKNDNNRYKEGNLEMKDWKQQLMTEKYSNLPNCYDCKFHETEHMYGVESFNKCTLHNTGHDNDGCKDRVWNGDDSLQSYEDHKLVIDTLEKKLAEAEKKITSMDDQLLLDNVLLNEKLKVAVEALEFYHKNCVAKEEFCNGEFADHEVTGFQPSNKIAREALSKIKNVSEGL